MSRRFILATLAIAAVVALAGCKTEIVTAPGDVATLNTVTSAGTGKALSAPDYAQLSFGVRAQSVKAEDALDEASAFADDIASALKKAGVDGKDIQTENVSVYPQYENIEGNLKAPQVVGYEAMISVRVIVRDIESIGDVISAGVGAGANDVSGPTFMLDDDNDAHYDAIDAAIEEARKRAEVMADAVGKDVGEVLSVSETGVSTSPVYAERAYGDVAASTVPIEPGQLEAYASVTVVFELK